MVDQLAACGACHSTWTRGDPLAGESPQGYLAGGNYVEDAASGFSVWEPNLTPDSETGLGRWTDDQLMRAIRDGIHADGHLLTPFMPFASYQHLSDEDLRAVVAYLRSVPPLRQPLPRRANRMPWVLGFLINRGVTHHLPTQQVAAPNRSDRVAYGKYLAQLGHCPACHALGDQGERPEDDPLYMAGSAHPFQKGVGKVWASNLTPDPQTGIGQFSAEQIKRALTSKDRLDGAPMAPPMVGLQPHLAGVSAEDLDALVAWLQSLRPIQHPVPERELNAKGL